MKENLNKAFRRGYKKALKDAISQIHKGSYSGYSASEGKTEAIRKVNELFKDLEDIEKGKKVYQIFQLYSIDMGSKELSGKISTLRKKENKPLHGLEQNIFSVCKKINKPLRTIIELAEKHVLENEKFKDELEKTKRFLRYAIPDIENLIECPFCFEYTNPSTPLCIKCGKELPIEEKNDKEK